MAQQDNSPTQSDSPPLLRLIPLGGLGEIGKNMMVLEAGENILIIDAGLMFPTNEMHGIDIVIPDAEYVFERLDWVRGIILTHGHEDHIGGLPYLMEQGLHAPIYATALTRGLLEVKLREHKLLDGAELIPSPKTTASNSTPSRSSSSIPATASPTVSASPCRRLPAK